MFEAHHAVVWRTLRRAGLDPDAAADVGQQAFIVAFERMESIWTGRERSFLLGTALRVARAQRRKGARYQLVDMDQHHEASEGGEQPALEQLDEVLSRLEPSLVEVLVMHDVEGLSSPEIAQALALAVGTVASRLRRARREFRAVCHKLELIRAREGAR